MKTFLDYKFYFLVTELRNLQIVKGSHLTDWLVTAEIRPTATDYSMSSWSHIALQMRSYGH